MTRSRSAPETYLYGYEYDWEHDAAETLQITPRKIELHQWGEKTITSGLFNLPGAENVSAVLFSNSGTIAKFNRMGVVGGFGSPRVLVMREDMRWPLSSLASATTSGRASASDLRPPQS